MSKIKLLHVRIEYDDYGKQLKIFLYFTYKTIDDEVP